MIWGSFLLALALGLIVSAALYFAYLWPQVEPEAPAPTRAASDEAGGERSHIDQLASDADEAEPAIADRQQPADEEPQQPPPSVPA